MTLKNMIKQLKDMETLYNDAIVTVTTDFVDGEGNLPHENWDIVNFGNLILVKVIEFSDMNWVFIDD